MNVVVFYVCTYSVSDYFCYFLFVAIYEFSNILSVKSEYSSIVFTFANFETVELNVKEDTCKLAQLVKR